MGGLTSKLYKISVTTEVTGSQNIDTIQHKWRESVYIHKRENHVHMQETLAKD